MSNNPIDTVFVVNRFTSGSCLEPIYLAPIILCVIRVNIGISMKKRNTALFLTFYLSKETIKTSFGLSVQEVLLHVKYRSNEIDLTVYPFPKCIFTPL